MDDLGSMILGTPAAPPLGARVPIRIDSRRAEDPQRILQDAYNVEFTRKPRDEDDAARRDASLRALEQEHKDLTGRAPVTPTQPVVAPVASAPAHDDLGAMILGDGKGNMPPVVERPRQMPAPVATGERAPTMPIRSAANPYEIVPQVIANKITGGGAAIMGGATGIGTTLGHIMSGDSIRGSLEAGGAAANDYQEKHTFQPTSRFGETAVQAAGLPMAQVEKVGDYVGEKTSNVLGPEMGAGAKTLVEIAPTLLMGKLGSKPGVRPSVKPVAEPVPPPGVSVPPYRGGRAMEMPTAAETPHPVAEVLPAQSAKQAPIEPTFEIPRENPPMPEKPSAPAEVKAREDALRKVGIEDIRKSATENNPKEASSQYITSKASQEPYGAGMTAQINHEKTALENHFGNVEQAAGGEVVRYGTPEEMTDRIKAGQTVKNAIGEGYEEHQAKTTELYKQAEKEHGDKPVELPGLSDYINKSENFVYDPDKALGGGVKAYLSRMNLIDENGALKPMSVADAEGIRKYINSKYNPQTKGVSAEMKGIIDEDVFSKVGGKTYEDARAHFRRGKETYENPKAMGDLLNDVGVNEKIPNEQVMDRVSALPEKQFGHIVETLRTDGKTAAINQVQTSLVNQIHRAGQSAVNEPWNAIAAAKEAAKLSGKLKAAFADKPELLQKVYDGIQAGNIVHIPTKYPGAGVQTQLLKNKFSEAAIQRAATGTGSIVGGGLGSIFGPAGSVGGAGAGALVGEHIGAKAATAARAARQTKQLGQEIQYGSDMKALPK